MIGWADVRWHFVRGRRPAPGTDGTIALDLLGPRDDALIEAVLDYHEAMVGEPRSANDPTALEALAGDYRLGRGLAATLSAWYRYDSPTIEGLAPEAARRLALLGAERPADLRRRIWEWANEGDGFAAGEERERLLAVVGADLGLDAALLWRLATADADRAAVLERAGEPPTAAELRVAYNRDAVEAALRKADRITFALPGLDGPTARHLIARCRALSLVPDLERATDGGLTLTLFGRPEQVGPAGGYGRQLATTATWLLTAVSPLGHAVLTLGQRRYGLALEASVLRAIGVDRAVREVTFGYDSAAEERLAREWRVAQGRGLAAGWVLEREPELLLVEGQVLLPDFRLRRGETEVYLELVGFWTPEYAERKRRKLEAAATAGVRLLVGADEALRERLGALPLPVFWYRESAGWTDALSALEGHFGRREARAETARTRLADLGTLLAGRDVVPEPELRAYLDLHTRAELDAALDAPGALPAGWRWLPGAGLARQDLLARLRDGVQALLDPAGQAPIETARTWIADTTGLDAGAAETLLGALPGLTLDWSDMFAPVVRAADTRGART